MGKLQTFCLIVFMVGLLVFPIILLSAFFVPMKIMSIMLSSDALAISLANLVIQKQLKEGS